MVFGKKLMRTFALISGAIGCVGIGFSLNSIPTTANKPLTIKDANAALYRIVFQDAVKSCPSASIQNVDRVNSYIDGRNGYDFTVNPGTLVRTTNLSRDLRDLEDKFYIADNDGMHIGNFLPIISLDCKSLDLTKEYNSSTSQPVNKVGENVAFTLSVSEGVNESGDAYTKFESSHFQPLIILYREDGKPELMVETVSSTRPTYVMKSLNSLKGTLKVFDPKLAR
jgi:hypothetical protein